MLPIDEQSECFSDWSEAVDVRVVDVQPTTTLADPCLTTESSPPIHHSTSNIETAKPTSLCMYVGMFAFQC